MKITIQLLTIILLFTVVLASCDNNNNAPAPQNLEVQDFIWEGLNLFYLWKENVPNLSNSKDDTKSGYINFLSATNPSNFFESLIYDRQYTDKWSWVVDDYIALENSFQGISKNNGVEYGLYYETNSTTDIFGYVRYILPNSDASTKNVARGFIFDAINGTQLTASNYRTLLSNESYTMNFADYNNGNPIANETSVALTKFEYQENPVYIAKTLDVGGIKIGYLMYNSFTSVFDSELNSAFAQLKAEGATELVLDLRYNSGGSVKTATYLAGMITGQFNGQLFTKEKWNNDLQEWFDVNNPDWLVNNFTNEINYSSSNGSSVTKEAIHSLNLTKLHVITTNSSASASELVINGLNPYIDVVTVGEKTTGKYVASITVYDSEDFGRQNTNPNHTWAMQPIVLEEVNKIGENDKDGFEPTLFLEEDLMNLGELGNLNEPLLASAISNITNVGKPSLTISKTQNLKRASDSKGLTRFGYTMHVEKKLPVGLIIRN
tara:strand:+ start:19965 stop:21440 length:1476 start_codon:yes stop_codon:yes gene_type:complete